ncbi:syntaxin-22-like isoform X2 [Salvia miltiorrhiza]|uniref:syntaxin-22-like isoform X2 n=1 Tax=Salvia miltiorrhiza TaxID=226208 RepID=UPI0025ACCD17|nr:syntaxin-22-like isoform X2 [Salvia miltiorrhiza]
MSFQDVGNKPTSAAKNQSESQVVAAALFQTNTAVAAFRRLVDAIGTSKDTPDHRLKLRSTRQRILDLVRDASAKLKSLTESDRTHDHPNTKVQDAKLAKDLQTTLQEFQKVQQLAFERESKFSPALPPPSSITISTPADQHTESSFERENDDSFLMEQERQEIRLLDNDVAFNEAVIEEREQGIDEIQGQIREVNEMFKDLAVLVNEQGVTVDDIEHSIDNSAVSTTQAKVQLSKGSRSGNSKTSWVSGTYLYLVAMNTFEALISGKCAHFYYVSHFCLFNSVGGCWEL